MYVVRIVGPTGYERYLNGGSLVGFTAARLYHHPSSARKSRDGFMKRQARDQYGRVMFITDIFDPKDPERHVDQ